MENNKELMLKGDKKIPFRVIIKRILRYLAPKKLSFILALILLLINVFLDVLAPLILERIVNILANDTTLVLSDSLNKIISLSVIYFVVGLVNQIILYFESMILQHAGQDVIYQIRMEVFTHIENMSQNQFDEMPVGSLVTRVASYTASMSDLFSNVLVTMLRNILTVISVYFIMIFISPILSLIMLGFVLIIIISSLIFSKIVTKAFRDERRYLSDLNTYLNENLSGMEIIQIFNKEEYKKKEFSLKNEKLRKAGYRVVIAFGIYRPFMTLLYILAVASTFGMGLYISLSSGEIVAFYLYLSKFFNPIQNLADQLNNLQKATTASERLFNLLDVEPDVRDSEDAIDIDAFKGKIEFRNVWFSYKKDEWILKDVSFVISPGETVAFVGATGAGKTTILGLIVRNYEIQSGSILIDDIDIRKIKIESLRRNIGQLLQDVFLFSGTIKSNITLHDDKFSDEEINNAISYVNADRFINKLEHGLDEEVIERGENFSQGQRQLLSFARTVLHKPQILILDEATSNIDTETEVLIQESLEKIKNIGTMIVVAHRLSTIQHADNIIVLSHGEIVESGNHQKLLSNKGYYYKLYELQFKNQ